MAAIYQWFQRDVQVLTTTLYPLEIVDAVQFTFDISGGSMSPVPQDLITTSGNILEVLLNQILLSYGSPEDIVDVSGALLEVLLISLLVTVDTPDEKLQLDFDINTTGWFMTAA